MKIKLITLAGILALSTLAPLQAGEITSELEDTFNDAINAAFIEPITQEFLDKHYSGLHVAHVGYLKSFVINGITYQYSVIMIRNDRSYWGLTVDYLYDTELHDHVFIGFHQIADFRRTGDRALLYDKNDPKRLFEGQEKEEPPAPRTN